VNFFAIIHKEAAQRNLRSLIIGGLAVNHYGYSRDTSDLDFFVSQNERTEWMQLLAGLGYASFHDGGSFIQYHAPDQSAWPVDFMLVQEKTFTPIFEAGLDAEFFGVKTKVPKLEHLIALKLHALKHTRMHRFLKDFLDVENLIRINQLDIQSPEARKLFDRYGTPDLYEKISQSLAGG